MRLPILTVLVASGLLSACAPAPMDDDAITGDLVVGGGDKEPGLADIELCDAEDYRGLIGSNIASATLPVGPRLRAFSVDDIITQEYIPQRTNVLYESDGEIIRVYCA